MQEYKLFINGEGAKLALGGKTARLLPGYFFEPTIYTDNSIEEFTEIKTVYFDYSGRLQKAQIDVE